jgi:hypothetical protein
LSTGRRDWRLHGADFFTPKLLEGPVFLHTRALLLAEPPLVDGVWLQGASGLTQAQATAEGYTAIGSELVAARPHMTWLVTPASEPRMQARSPPPKGKGGSAGIIAG